MKRTLLALSAVSALAFAGASFAQEPARTSPPAASPAARHLAHQRGAPGAERRMERFDPAKMAERRIEHLRTLLQLRPEQDAALRAFVAATTPAGHPGQRLARRGAGDRAERQGMTTPQRLEALRKRMTERQARFDQVSAATLKFYGQLSPSQQKVFDTQQRGFGRGLHGPRHGGFRGHMSRMGARPGDMGGRWGPQGGPPPTP